MTGLYKASALSCMLTLFGALLPQYRCLAHEMPRDVVLCCKEMQEHCRPQSSPELECCSVSVGRETGITPAVSDFERRLTPAISAVSFLAAGVPQTPTLLNVHAPRGRPAAPFDPHSCLILQI